jgi:uncharacterized protein
LTDEAVASEAQALSEFERACWRLTGFDRLVSPEWVDGYLSAVLAGPRAVQPDEWLPAMLGDAFDRVFADPADVRFARRALTSRWRELAAQLDAEALLEEPDVIRLAPWIRAYEEPDRLDFVAQGHGTAEQAQDELQPGVAWARGFKAATISFAADWVVPDGATDAGRGFLASMDCIAALQRPAVELKDYLDAHHPQGHPSRDELIDAACLAAQDLRLYWVEHAPRPPTRRVAQQPGRNEPCHCGSGKKFKKCHGA